MKDIEQIAVLVGRLQNGDESAAGDLYNASYGDVYYFILKTVQDTELAADLTQDTFIEILQNIGKLNDPGAFPAWSRQIAYHRCTAYFKKRHDLLADENEEGQTVFDSIVEEREEFIPDKALDKEDLKQTIHAMIDELPPEQRSAILMRYFNELSVKEIADIQGVTEGTVKSRLNYGRKTIKQAVESYEKKNGVKLRCVGVVPLLLWLFRGYAASGGSNAAASTAAALATEGVKATVNSAAAEGAKVGAKAAGKLAAKKLIAGITAASLVAGGVSAGLLLQEKPKEEPEKPPMVWVGYGTESRTKLRRFDLTVEEMDEDTISGHLEVSIHYNTKLQSDFAGTGTVSGDTVLYTITYEEPAVLGSINTYTYEQMELIYYKEADVFSFNTYYRVNMEREDTQPPQILVRNARWSGYGRDGFYNVISQSGHLFEVDVYEMSETNITGKLKLTYQGAIDHETKFVGRGYQSNGLYFFEIKLEDPRTVEDIVENTAETFWLQYDPEADTLSISPAGLTIPSLELYSVVMSREK